MFKKYSCVVIQIVVEGVVHKTGSLRRVHHLALAPNHVGIPCDWSNWCHIVHVDVFTDNLMLALCN
jgi:hypothetical protein